jgi:hypothetical protein
MEAFADAQNPVPESFPYTIDGALEQYGASKRSVPVLYFLLPRRRNRTMGVITTSVFRPAIANTSCFRIIVQAYRRAWGVDGRLVAL